MFCVCVCYVQRDPTHPTCHTLATCYSHTVALLIYQNQRRPGRPRGEKPTRQASRRAAKRVRSQPLRGPRGASMCQIHIFAKDLEVLLGRRGRPEGAHGGLYVPSGCPEGARGSLYVRRVWGCCWGAAGAPRAPTGACTCPAGGPRGPRGASMCQMRIFAKDLEVPLGRRGRPGGAHGGLYVPNTHTPCSRSFLRLGPASWP